MQNKSKKGTLAQVPSDNNFLPDAQVKGTVSGDFRPSVFFLHQSIHPGPLIKGLFEYKFEFAKIFEFFKMHAVSLTPYAKYDTACTIDERFERPWQPLKGISIKNIYRYAPELSYPVMGTHSFIRLFVTSLPLPLPLHR
jgi:hypothetical protein